MSIYSPPAPSSVSWSVGGIRESLAAKKEIFEEICRTKKEFWSSRVWNFTQRQLRGGVSMSVCQSLELWNTGALEHWSTGTLEHWSTGTLEHWSTGALEQLTGRSKDLNWCFSLWLNGIYIVDRCWQHANNKVTCDHWQGVVSYDFKHSRYDRHDYCQVAVSCDTGAVNLCCWQHLC